HGSTTRRSTSMTLRTSPENSRKSWNVLRRVQPSFLEVNVGGTHSGLPAPAMGLARPACRACEEYDWPAPQGQEYPSTNSRDFIAFRILTARFWALVSLLLI